MTAVHQIKDGRFMCTAEADASCRHYPACMCEEFTPELHGTPSAAGHESVQQDVCWLTHWFTAVDLDDMYVGPDGEDAHGMTFPDGPIEHEWDGDSIWWRYADGTEPVWAEEDE